MPWKPSDAKKKKKGLSPKESVKWSKIANAVLEKTGDDASAIRIANSKTKRKK